MKRKIYTLGVIGFLGLIGAGFLLNESNTKVYQAKDYTKLFIALGDAKGGILYNQKIRENEDGIIDIEFVRKVRKAVANREQSKATADRLFFEELGPNLIGGRNRAIIRDNQTGNESVLYTGGVRGGVFVSYNSGEFWFGYSGNEANGLASLCIGDIGQTTDGSLWVGTGTTHDVQGSFGDGLFRRIGDGSDPVTYEQIMAPGDMGTGSWGACNRVKGHPTNPDRLYVATNQGLMVSSNATSSDPTFFNGMEVGNGIFVTSTINDFEISNDGNTIHVSGNGGIVYKLKDNGNDNITVESSTTLGPGVDSPGRAALALSPSDNNIIYASIGNTTNGNCTYGIFQSKDAGDTWNSIGGNGGPIDLYQSSGCQGSNFDNDIGVFPNDPGKIIVGGVGLYGWTESETAPGTGGWAKIALLQTEGAGGGITDTNWVHADKHRVLILDSLNVYLATDGGVHRSIDGGRTWGVNNNGLNIYQCYSVDAAFGIDLDSIGFSNEQVMGGAQDNGTVLIGTNPNRPSTGFDLSSGDGADCAFSNLASLAFVSSQNGNIRRTSFRAGASSIFSGEIARVCNPSGRTPPRWSCGYFITRFEYWETAYADKTLDSIKIKAKAKAYSTGDTIFYTSNIGDIPMIYVSPRDVPIGDSINVPDYAQSKFAFVTDPGGGVQGVYMTRDAANLNEVDPQWQLIIGGSNSYPDQLNGNVTDLKFTPDGNQLYVSTNSALYRIDNLNEGGDSATLDIRSPLSVLTTTRVETFSGGGGAIESIAVDPNNADNVLVGFGGYGGTVKIRKLTNASTATTGQGNSVGIQGDLVQGLPIFSCMIADHDEKTVLVGTDFGVYASDDALTAVVPTWHEVWGMPKIPVYDMVQQTDQWLYGDNGPQLYENKHFRKIYLGTHARGYWATTSLTGLDDDQGDSKEVSKREATIQLKIYPNPMSETGIIEIDLQNNEIVTVEIYDLSGKIVHTISNSSMQAGLNKIQFNAGELKNGTYLASLRTESEVKVSKFVVMK